jgi:hypothetical protein
VNRGPTKVEQADMTRALRSAKQAGGRGLTPETSLLRDTGLYPTRPDARAGKLVALDAQPERTTIKGAVRIIGLSERTIQAMAARGEIPGAAKFGRRWTFDKLKLRQYVNQREQETWQGKEREARPSAAIGAVRSFGPALSSRAGNSAGRLIQMIRRSRKRGTRQAESAS